MREKLASIEIGSHTARLLVAQDLGPSIPFRPLARRRAYIRLAQDFDYSAKRIIQPEAIDRTLEAVEGFLGCMKMFNVHSVHAVATGVVREAANKDEFLDRIREYAGINVRPIDGSEEALLTGRGVLSALDIRGKPFLVFDLGGGSTEFLFRGEGETIIRSIPLGAAVLSQEYLKSDPPDTTQLDALSRHIDGSLEKARLHTCTGLDHCPIIATGGTVTALAAMIDRIALEEITPERVNGMILKKSQVEGLLGGIQGLSVQEMSSLPGLDAGRAELILAGSLIVIRILKFFESVQLTISLSDLLEGILIDRLRGEGHV
ncbi:MAG: hypothetical protein SV775_06970 [Thermodesulfobacteriota bacterium]|nr:hypothetical protein [Thermodesulfobacteriota bacterium]